MNRKFQLVLNKINKTKTNRLLLILLGIWFIVNVIQTIFTDIIPDEAYYHFYSENLAWGYFDHPPLVSLMVKLSSSLFGGGFAIRFTTIVLQLFTLVLLWKTIDNKYHTQENLFVFFGIAASIVMFVVYGFITTPDSPLLFFTALFLFSYKRFLGNESLTNCLLLSIAMAGLVYSKYQGVLVIFFVILSNPKLLLNYRFLLSSAFALLLFSPHLFWQLDNDFPSFRYHTSGRAKPFKLRYLIEYLPNQAANFNPFTLAVALYIIFKIKAKDNFFKSLYFIVSGMILFFWISTYRGHSQPQWTIAASIPMILFVFCNAVDNHNIMKYLKRFVFPSIVILFIFRIIIACDTLPFKLEFYNQKRWVQEVEKIAGNRVVVFRDGYQRPSLYRFYSKKEATTVNSLFYRKNQYDMYGFNHQYSNRDLMIVTDKSDSLAIPYPLFGKDTLYVRFADKLVTGNDVHISPKILHDNVVYSGDTLSIEVFVENKGETAIFFGQDHEPVTFHFVVTCKDVQKSLDVLPDYLPESLEPGESFSSSFSVLIPESFEIGSKKGQFAIKVPPFREGYNSKPFDFKIL